MVLNTSIYIFKYNHIYVWVHGNNNGSGLFGSYCPFSCLTSEFLGVSEDRIRGPKNTWKTSEKKKSKLTDYF